jgi:hypothetical protein
MAYFFALLGAAGVYGVFVRSKSKSLKGLVGSLLVLSLAIYAVVIEYRYVAEDYRLTSSEWIEENILSSADSLTIGMNAGPYFAAPHIITKEWTHNKHPDSDFYPDRYTEMFVIPDYELTEFGGNQILPDRLIVSETEKMRWLESMSPEYVLIFHSARYGYKGWAEYFAKSEKYDLIKHFPRYELLGVGNLAMYSYHVHVFRRATPGAS